MALDDVTEKSQLGHCSLLSALLSAYLLGHYIQRQLQSQIMNDLNPGLHSHPCITEARKEGSYHVTEPIPLPAQASP